MAELPESASVVVVTGANQGIGLQLVREFAAKGLATILTSRNERQGRNAVELLKQEGLRVGYHQLDITDPNSIQSLASWLSQEHGGLDILVNNAGVSGFDGMASRKMVLDTNYYGTKMLTEALLPLVKPGGRIVNISSKAGDLNHLKNEWGSKLDDVATLSSGVIDEMFADYLKTAAEAVGDAKQQQQQLLEKGWPAASNRRVEDAASYCISKAALNAYSRMLAMQLAANEEGRVKGVSVNCACPGATNTAMTGLGHGLDVAADTPVWLSLAPRDVVGSGNFYTLRTNVGFRGIPLNVFGRLLTDAEVTAFMES